MAMWRFITVKSDDIESDPTQEEFFSNEDVDRLDSLVREAIQNSLDARRPGQEGPVVVRFRFSAPQHALDPAAADRYMKGLWPHLEAAGLRPETLPPLKPMDYLLIEDFGTTGLDGETGVPSSRARQHGVRSNFYDFWRRSGQSHKGGAERGRWGLGKTVFPNSSSVRAFFGLTVRNDDGRCLLMGQSILKSHKLADELYQPYGFYARYEEGGFQQPIEDGASLQTFRADFGIQRAAEPGLTLVIPFPHEEIKADGVLRATIKHYFYPILAGKLVVQVESHDQSRELTASTIRDVASTLPELADRGIPDPLFGFVRSVLAIPPGNYLTVRPPGNGGAPKWGSELFEAASLEGLRERFERQEVLAFRVPVVVKPRGRPPETSYFDVAVKRDSSLKRGLDHYIRQGLAVHGVRQLGSQTVLGLLVAEDEPVSRFLGDAENPAHMRWNEQNERFKLKYHHAVWTLRFVKNGLLGVVEQLTRPPEGRDPDLLTHIFYLDEPAEKAGPGKARPTQPPRGEEAVFQVHRIAGGFRITSKPGTGEPPPGGRIRAAYQVRRGNPFRRYDRRDFDVSRAPITVEATGARILAADGNTLDFDVQQANFSISVTGFDCRRDLSVSVDPIPEAG